MILFLDILQVLLRLVWWVLVIQAILSWLIAFNVISTYNEFVRALWQGLQVITDPIYRPIRRILPNTGGLDLSPLVAIVVLIVIQQAVMPALYRVAEGGPL